jgi:hypothetical protein
MERMEEGRKEDRGRELNSSYSLVLQGRKEERKEGRKEGRKGGRKEGRKARQKEDRKTDVEN